MTINDLSRNFGIEGKVSIREGTNEFTLVELRHPSGASATLSLYGAHVLSWKDSSFRERLFLSSRATYTKGKAIRGGIPVIFPQFGPGTMPSHGFARTTEWSLNGSRVLADGTVGVTLALRSSPETEKLWPCKFYLLLDVLLADTLTLRLMVDNRGDVPFSFTNAFHTYFPVEDISKTTVQGLRGLTYLDNVAKRAPVKETAIDLSIDREVDRVYCAVPDAVVIQDLVPQLSTTIEKVNMADAVVWNPWIEKSKTLSDLGPEDYKKFICVETGNIATPMTLEAQSSITMMQKIS